MKKPPVVGARGANAKWNNKAGALRTPKGVPLFGLISTQKKITPDLAVGRSAILPTDSPRPEPLPSHFRRGEMACIRCGHATETGVVTAKSITGLHEICWGPYVAGVALVPR